jgi:alcohol dehydrogenase
MRATCSSFSTNAALLSGSECYNQPMNSPGLPHWFEAPFDFQLRTRLVFGVNSVERVGELARAVGARTVLLVTDRGIVAAGHASRVQKLLEKARLKLVVFSHVEENPTTRVVQECVAVARDGGIDTIVAVGGGSSMDAAKGCNFILTNGGRMQDYWGVGKAAKPMLPLIAIPTTAGTGSECQSFALISDEKTHQKMACGDPKAAPRVALLDPLLTLTQPTLVTQCTGIDAVAHALETAVTRKRTELSWLLSRESFQLAVQHLPLVLRRRDNLQARAAMQLAAAWAGAAIENSMLGAAHSAANPLTAHYEIIHGRAVGMMLPHVVRFNGGSAPARRVYAALARSARLAAWQDSDQRAFGSLLAALERLLDAAAIPRRLSDYDIPRSALPTLSREAARQWTAQFNPRPVGVAGFRKLYEAAW